MKTLSAVRFASYAMIIVIAILLQQQTGVIPVRLLSDEEVKAVNSAVQRREADRIALGSIRFQDSKLSGSEVIIIARKKARDEGQDFDKFFPSKLVLRVVDKRLVWTVIYETVESWPRQFEIKIEDSTGNASYTDTTATM